MKKRLLQIVFALIYVVALCSAQTDATSSSGSPPITKEASPAPATQALTSPPAAQAASQAAPASDQLPPARKPAAEGKSPEGKAAAAPAETKTPYIIGSLDVLIIKVWNNPNLSGPVDVRSDGMLSLPLIGEIKADGLTARQLKDSLTERLGEFLNSPEVDVQVAKVNSKRYFVYGGVGRPGEFPLIRETTVMDALSNVGGFRDFSNPKKIYVQRGTQRFNFNYKDVSKGKNMEQNILLQNGDRIFVPE